MDVIEQTPRRVTLHPNRFTDFSTDADSGEISLCSSAKLLYVNIAHPAELFAPATLH